ncbi:hypothetical protein A9Q86_09035 [Flavobacteriales bacterium 33_180_T64]|nr:hypothetical protein A9Q86_09035 [Flavobacteriales bacterium 33_180_T64]
MNLKLYIKSIISFFEIRNKKHYSRNYSEDDIKKTYAIKENYNKLKQELINKNTLVSTQLISPIEDTPFDSLKYKSILKSLGDPKYKVLTKLGDRKIVVSIFYTGKGRFKSKIISYSFKNEVFLLTYEFKNKTRKQIKEITNVIRAKYLDVQELDLTNDFIIDENNVILSFDIDFDLSLSYHSNSEIYNYVDYLIDLEKLTKRDKKTKRYKEFYDKL